MATTQILKLVAGMFNGAPGGAILGDLSGAVNAGMSLPELADILENTNQFQSLVDGLDTAGKVEFLMNNFGLTADGVEGSAATRAENFFTNSIEDGVGLGYMVYQAIVFLESDNLPEEFADVAALLNNKALVAAVHAENYDAIANVAAGQALFVGVTSTFPMTQAEALQHVKDIVEPGNGEPTPLALALEALKAAREAEAEAVEAEADALAAVATVVGTSTALGVNAPADVNPTDGEVDEDELDVWVAAYAAGNIENDLNAATTALEAAESDLAVGRATIGDSGVNFDVNNADVVAVLDGRQLTDARLNTALNVAQAALDEALADETSDEAIAQAALEAAQDALAEDIATNGTNAELLTNLRAGLVAEVLAGNILAGDDYDGVGAPTVGVVIANIDTALAGDADDQAAYVGMLGGLTVDGSFDPSIQDVAALIVGRVDLHDDVATAQTAFDSTDLAADVAEIQGLIDAREDLIDEVDAIQAYVDELSEAAEAYQAAVGATEEAADVTAAALAAITNAEDDDPAGLGITLGVLGTDNGTDGDDVFLFEEDKDGTFTVNGFGEEGVDRLYFGEGYQLVQIAEGKTINNNVGSVGTLEILWQQIGDDLHLYVESEPFAGNGSSTADVTTITLVGFNAEDITGFESGFLVAGVAVA